MIHGAHGSSLQSRMSVGFGSVGVEEVVAHAVLHCTALWSGD